MLDKKPPVDYRLQPGEIEEELVDRILDHIYDQKELKRSTYWKIVCWCIRGKCLPDNLLSNPMSACPELWAPWNRFLLLLVLLTGKRQTVEYPTPGWSDKREVIVLEHNTDVFGWSETVVVFWPKHWCWDLLYDCE